jgi:hypothetical protein
MVHDLPTDDQDPDDPVTFMNTEIKAALYNHMLMGGCSLVMTSPHH